MKELTKVEEQIMQVIWKLERALVHDVIEQLPQPKPAYSTVSTVIRILEKKGFVHYKAYGKTHEYFALVSKEEYTKQCSEKLLNNYFEGSMEKMLSFFAKEKKLKLKDLDDVLNII